MGDSMSEPPLLRRIPCCQNISPQAREFMTRSSRAEWIPADISPLGVAELRSGNSAVGALAWEKVRKECPVICENGVVGDVQCQWVSPLRVEGTEVVLYIFGGGFVVGSPEDDLCITARVAWYANKKV